MGGLNALWQKSISEWLKAATQSSWATALIDDESERPAQTLFLATFWGAIDAAWQSNNRLTLPCFLQHVQLVLACPSLCTELFPEQVELPSSVLQLHPEFKERAYKKIENLNAPAPALFEDLKFEAGAHPSMQEYWVSAFYSLALTLPGRLMCCPGTKASHQEDSMRVQVRMMHIVLMHLYTCFQKQDWPKGFDTGGEIANIIEMFSHANRGEYFRAGVEREDMKSLPDESRKIIKAGILRALENQQKMIAHAGVFHTGIYLDSKLKEKLNKRILELRSSLNSGMPYSQTVCNAYRSSVNLPLRDQPMATMELQLLENITRFEKAGVLTPRLFAQKIPQEGTLSYELGSDTHALILEVNTALKEGFAVLAKNTRDVPGLKLASETLMGLLESSKEILESEVPSGARELQTVEYPEDLFAGEAEGHQHSEACGQAQKYYIYNHIADGQLRGTLSVQMLTDWREDLCCHAWKWGRVKSPVSFGPLQSWAVRMFEKVEYELLDLLWMQAGGCEEKLLKPSEKNKAVP